MSSVSRPAWITHTAEQATIVDQLADIAARRSANAAERDGLDDELKTTIRTAFKAGMKVGPIADAAKISKARAYQYRDGRR